MERQLLSIRETCARTTLSRTSIWLKIKNGQFPKPVSLGRGIRKAFIASEIDDWVNERVVERDLEAA